MTASDLPSLISVKALSARTGMCITLCASVLSGCAGSPDAFVQAPLNVPPPQRLTQVERVNNGAIYQPGMLTDSMFSSDRKPRNIGDTLKINIQESLSANSTLDTKTSRENKIATKGPGGSGTGSTFLDRLVNLDATAAGSDAYKGSGSTDSKSAFQGQLAASVINVLPNGNLLVAGERSISLNGGISTLRFSGIVNPNDIKPGNVVASADVVNARFEVGGKGDVQDAASRTWLQRLMTNSLSVW